MSQPYQQGYQQGYPGAPPSYGPPPPGWNPQQGEGQPLFGQQRPDYQRLRENSDGDSSRESHDEGYMNQNQQGPMQPGMMPPPMPHASYVPDQGEDGQPKYTGAVAFTDKTIRQGFIRKVFAILTVQLLIVCAIVAPIYLTDSVRVWCQRTPGGLALYIVSYILFLVTYITLVCCEGIRRKHPLNLIILAVFTLCTGYMTAMICARHDVISILLALGITCASCFGIMLFACQTKYDFTSWIGVMCVITLVLSLFGFMTMILSIFTHVKILYMVYAGAGALIFMIWLAIDVQMVIGGKKVEIGPDDYIFASIQLFLDIIYIFWFILELVGGARND